MTNLSDVQNALKAAHDAYMSACQAEDTARRERTACQNKLNEAQREFDKAIEQFKAQNAGRDTDWHMQKHGRSGVPV